MLETGLNKRSLRSKLAIVISAALIVLLTLVLELNLNQFQIEKQMKMFGLLKEQNPNSLLVSYNNDPSEDLRSYDSNEVDLPTYIRAESDLTIQFFEDTFMTLKKGTELRTIIFRKNRLHMALVSGQVVVDNRLSTKPVTIQTKNILIRPFERTRFMVGNLEDQTVVTSINGQVLVGRYQGRELQEKIYIAKHDALSFFGEIMKPSSVSITDVSEDINETPVEKLFAENIFVDADAWLAKKGILNLKYKGQSVSPSNSKGYLASVTKNLTFNSKKKEFLSVYPFSQQILIAKNNLMNGDNSGAAVALDSAKQEFKQETARFPLSINTYTQEINKSFESLVGLSEEDKLNALKTYFGSSHTSQIEEEFHLSLALSYLEDAFIQFDKGKIVEGEKTIQLLATLVNGADLETEEYQFVIKGIDNILEKQVDSNFETTYNIRKSIFDKNAEKFGPSFKSYYERKNLEHVERLQGLFDSGELSATKVKESAIIIINSLDRLDQLKYDKFITELNIEGITLGF